ncbi:MAG: hypothetical protein J0M04_01715 [Verrucomicrobia bacterium]|nr:hypothetical protein [Verrucomicrobiota bacterium]
MAKPKKKLTPAQRAEKKRRKLEFMTIFINGKQKRVPRPPTIDGMDVEEFIRQNADHTRLRQLGAPAPSGGSGRLAGRLLVLCGMLAGGSWLCGQEQAGTGGGRLSIRDQVAAALESGANAEAKSALVKALAAKWLEDEKDADIQAMLESIRVTADEELAARIFRDFLADTALALPAACALPAADDPFFKAVEAGRANAIRDWLGAALRTAGAPTLRQVAALTKPPEWLREGFIKWLMHDQMFGADHPRAGGQLAARLLLLLDERERPGSRTIQAGFVEWQMEDPAARGEVRAMAAYLAGVTEACPAFATASGWNDAVVRPMGMAWRKRLLEVAGKARNGAGTDWRKTLEDCFVPPLKDMAKDERMLAATGLTGCLELLLEPAKTTGWAELSSVKFTGFPATRAERVKALMDLFQPYPEFQLPITRSESANLPPDAAARPEEPPAQLVAALEDATIPPEQRFIIVGDLSRIPKPRYQEVAAAGFVRAMRDILRAGDNLSRSSVPSYLYTFHHHQHPAWIKAAADTAAMTAAAYKTQAKGEAWSDNAVMRSIIETALIGQATDLTADLIHAYGTAFRGDMGLVVALSESGRTDLAVVLCTGLPDILSDGGCRLGGTPTWLPGLLEKIESQADRYRIELAISTIPNKERAKTIPETAMARLMPLAGRFGETADMPDASRMQCLALLCREPTAAYLIKGELERVIDGLDIADLKRGGRRTADLNAASRWSLETAHLGNLLRDGRCAEISERLEPILADPSSFEHAHDSLAACVRVFYEHVLWLLADGRADRVADIIPLSLRLYASIMGTGWNYRDQATMFVELCHASDKRYAEFETWLAGVSDDARADYRQRRYGPKEFKIPGLSAFHQLAVFSDLRGGWDGEACEDLRIAGILALTGDPALVKAQSEGRPLAELVSINIKRWATDTPADKLAVIARWRERHPNHPLLDETERLLRENTGRPGSR